ncbi:hypothetical protein BGZ61DRAFT_487488 [Ilyonectria robusta]|uniref:uncharacterized protein n=1 Tax=Ilyonectria robusta TaxID=1079257 RepID=UPI001E8D22E8|nr:uncharacterized protein BGZ61DRAFT_487488 [Ilyonectria robusta]KAH8652572.1 hypothetical protein BGZ61DRAFT_487488 [Ilyonectria robusta]
MDGLKIFAPSPNPSPNPSTAHTRTTQPASSSSNVVVRHDDGSPSSSIDMNPTVNVRRLLPTSVITNISVHDLVILAGPVEPVANQGTVSTQHRAGHIADAVCRNPSSIVGTGATFTTRQVQVQGSCIESGYVVTKVPRITSKKEEAGSGLQRRLRRILFEIRVLTHEPLMFHDNIVRFLGIS